MTERQWKRYVAKLAVLSVVPSVIVGIIVVYLLPVPALLVAPIIIGTSYVSDQVLRRRLDRRLTLEGW